MENFEFKILEYCEESMLIEKEQYYCELYKPRYNMIYPKQDTIYNKEVKDRHKESCKKSWENRSEESKNNTLNNLKLGKGGRKDKMKIKAINVSTLEELEFDSLKEASEYLNISVSSISQILNPNHKRKNTKGYTFLKI